MQNSLGLFLILLAGFVALPVNAQRPSQTGPDEYIQSSSPLPGGGRVTSRSAPGSGVQTVTTAAYANAAARPLDTRSLTNQNSRALGTSQFRGNVADSGSVFSITPQTVANYPYPATGLPRQSVARPTQAQPTNTQVVYPAFRATANNTNQSTGFSVPTLGITPTPPTTATNTTYRRLLTTQHRMARTAGRVAQSCDCAPGFGATAVPPTRLQVQGYQVPAYDPNAALAAPRLTIQPPGVAPQYNPGTLQPSADGLQTPSVGIPQFGPTQSDWWTPLYTGSGAYQPLLRLVNMQPGTYLGRGIIGQPTAYVDGQPLRNLLRYVFP